MTNKTEKRNLLRSIIDTFSSLYSLKDYGEFNRNLKHAASLTDNRYFPKQIFRNRLITFFSRVPLIVGIFFFASSLMSNKGKVIALNVLTEIKKIRTITNLNSIKFELISERDLDFLQYSTEYLLLGALMSVVLVYFARTKNRLLTENNRFNKKELKSKEGSDNDGKQFYLICPAGVLYTLGDESAKELSENTKFWQRIGVVPSEYIEDPSDNKIVFFEKGFNLANEYIY